MSSNDDLPSANPNDAGMVVYGESTFVPLEFIPEGDAYRTALMVYALTEAHTWGDLRRLDPELYRDAPDAFREHRDASEPDDDVDDDDYEEEIIRFPPPDDASFDLYAVSLTATWLMPYTNSDLE